jgi:hypothetical protein
LDPEVGLSFRFQADADLNLRSGEDCGGENRRSIFVLLSE